jgi:hypothetical protein
MEALIANKEAEITDELLTELRDEFFNSGMVPFKEKDEIRKRFNNTFNRLLGRIKSSNLEADITNYKQMVSTWQNNPSGGNNGASAKDIRTENEERRLRRELQKLEQEIATLQNNMEFFKNSKNADALKVNLENQISQLNDGIVEIKQKIKILKEMNTVAK